jgi:hypothetical protein
VREIIRSRLAPEKSPAPREFAQRIVDPRWRFIEYQTMENPCLWSDAMRTLISSGFALMALAALTAAPATAQNTICQMRGPSTASISTLDTAPTLFRSRPALSTMTGRMRFNSIP